MRLKTLIQFVETEDLGLVWLAELVYNDDESTYEARQDCALAFCDSRLMMRTKFKFWWKTGNYALMRSAQEDLEDLVNGLIEQTLTFSGHSWDEVTVEPDADHLQAATCSTIYQIDMNTRWIFPLKNQRLLGLKKIGEAHVMRTL